MDFYYTPESAPCRAVLMTAAAVGVKLNKMLLKPAEQEHVEPEFLKVSPQHTIPTLVDNGFSILTSRAIIVYLAEKYGKDDSLYPKDPQQRALVDQRLYFDMDMLYHSFADYYYPQFRFSKPADPELYKKMEAAIAFLNTFLEGQQYVAGNTPTVADITILATVSSFVTVGFPLANYPNVAKWYDHVQKVAPGREENQNGLEKLKELIASMRRK